MIEVTGFILDFLRVDIFNTFALLTIPLLLLRNLPKTKERFIKWDDSICKFIVFCGLLYTATIIAYWGYVLLFLGAEKEDYVIANRATGPYAWAYLGMAFSWLVLTLPLRFKILRRNIGFRLLLIPLYLFTMEQFIILVTSYHRDYASSEWTENPVSGFISALAQTPYWPFYLLLKLVLFSICVVIFYWIRQKIRNDKASSVVS